MVNKIISKGFIALTAYCYYFALISLILFIIAITVNAIVKSRKFDIDEIRKLFMTNMIFMLIFALLDYFLV